MQMPGYPYTANRVSPVLPSLYDTPCVHRVYLTGRGGCVCVQWLAFVRAHQVPDMEVAGPERTSTDFVSRPCIRPPFTLQDAVSILQAKLWASLVCIVHQL
jgi:hypothetical protein